MEHAYEIEKEENREQFVFNSGIGADIFVKVVSFDLVNIENKMYNLGLGDADGDPWLASTKIDFEVMSNNGDVLKVMNTIALCVEMFLEKHPDANIFFSGNTEKRTRVYLKLIARNWKMLQGRFVIQGITENNYEDFEPNTTYFGIVFTKKS